MARRIFVGSRSLAVRCCVFACVFLIVTAPGVDSLQFLEQPKQILRGFLGLNLQINCSTDDPNATVSLMHQENPFAPLVERKPSPNKLIETGQVFTILSLTVDDAGNHRCKANNSKQTIEWPPMTGMTFLTKGTTPKYFVLKPYKQIVIPPGQEVKVICETEGVSIATLQWKKQINENTATPVPDSLVTNAADRSTNRVSATLTITNAQVQDSGTYTCEVTAYSKNDDRSISVAIREPFKPRIVPYSASTTIKEGLPKTLSCKATAFPRANITWLMNGQELNLTDCKVSADSRTCKHEFYEIKEEQLSNPLHSTGLLKIPNAFYPRDHGTFECIASNEYHSTSLVIPLNVQVAPLLEKGPELETIHQLVETDYQVACFVEKSNPLPQFQWKYQVMTCTDSPEDCLPDEKKWQTVDPVPSSQVATKKSVVSIAKNDPSAFYLCEATNSLGNDSMLVKFRRMEMLRKYIEVDPNSKKSFTEKFTLRLPCINRCYPLCKNIYFSRNGMMLQPGNDTRINVSEVTQDRIRKVVLTITNLTLNDSGTYQCAAAPKLYDRVNITVEALVKPVIKSITAHDGMEGSSGHPAQLICLLSHAVPMAEITWLLVGDDGTEKKITGSNDLGGRIDACASRASGYFYFRANQRSHLVICNPKYKEHSGQYKCHAANIAGSDSNSTLLNVYAPPTIIDPSDGFSKEVDFGKPVTLNCTAKGNPLPNITWVRNTTDSSTVLSNDVGTVQLYISSVGEKHFGKYKCLATNRFGSAVVSISFLRAGDKIANKGDPPPLSTAAMVGISVGIGVIFIVLLVVFCLYRRQKKQIDEYKELYFLKKTDYEIDPDRSLLEQCNNLPYDPDWEFPEERLILGDVLGSGAFGQVIKAEAIGIISFNPRDKAPESFKRRSKIRRSTRAKDLAKEHVAGGERSLKTPVAVKTLKEGASQAEYKDLASELKILIHLGQHKNIINLLGACTRGKRLMVIMEFAPHGSLLSFLRARREIYEATWTKTVNNPHQEFTLVDLVMAGYQVSRGMAFLASKKCVHRDMAARNVLVGNDYVMKIADFGLARDIYKDDLYVKKTSGLLPVKWMAPESLFDRVYTEKTDVWSFGILMWEVFTLGGTPYPGLPTEELLDYLSEGKRMEMPDRCPLEVYTIMRDCWAHDPHERPTFFTLNERLGKVLERNLTKDNPYLALQMEEDEEEFGQGYYLQPCESEIRDSKRYVESPVHTPGDEVKDPPTFGADNSKDDDGTRYGSPLPPLPPGLPIMSDEDIQNSPLPPIPPAYEDALNDEDAEDDFDPRSPPSTSNKGGRESGIDMDYPADGGDYVDDVRPSNPTHDGSKPVAIEMGDMGKLPDTEVKTNGGRSGHETEL